MVLFILQLNMDSQVEGLSFNHNLGSGSVGKGQDSSYSTHQGVLDLLDSAEQQFLNPNQNQNYGSGRHAVPNIILTGGCDFLVQYYLFFFISVISFCVNLKFDVFQFYELD